VLLSSGLNWDLAFLRRSLAGDFEPRALPPSSRARRWRQIERRRAAAPTPAVLRDKAVVVLDAIAPGELPAGSRRGALAAGAETAARSWPSAARGPRSHCATAAERLGRDLAIEIRPDVAPAAAAPIRRRPRASCCSGTTIRRAVERAWRAAAPLTARCRSPVCAGDRVLIGTRGGGPPAPLHPPRSGAGRRCS
jgi:hypothetical protein